MATNQSEQIIPLPCLPTYIARRPVRSKSSVKDTVNRYNPVFSPNWQKAYLNHTSYYHNCVHSPFVNIDLQQTHTAPKQYDTYRPTFQPRVEIDLNESYNRIRPLSVPHHTTRTSEKWSRFLDEFPDRFKINYPTPDNENHFYVQNRPGRYPCPPGQEPPSQYGGLIGEIRPATNTYRQTDPIQMAMRVPWSPYGTPHPSYRAARH